MTEDPDTTRRGMLRLIAASSTVALSANAEDAGAPNKPAVTQPNGNRTAEINTRLADYHLTTDGNDWTPALDRAFDALSATRTAHPAYPRWGVGIIHAGRGILSIKEPPRFSASQVGFGIIGAGRFATVFTTSITAGQAFLLNPSGYSHFSDFTILNEATFRTDRSDDAAFTILGNNGGHMTAFSRIVFSSFTYGISVSGTTNGDFTHATDCEFTTRYGYSNSHNKNAVSANFDNCSFDCASSVFLLGGSGEVSMRGGGANVRGALVEYAEGAGINGIYPQSVEIDHVKLEYSGTGTSKGDRLLIDGRACVLSPDAGGADTVTALRDTTYALGNHPPGAPAGSAYDDQVIVDLAGGRHRVHALGGYLRGTIRYASDYLEDRARWLFGRMRGTPRPSRLQLAGVGSHPLIEWWGNEGVADQYRGGQSGLRCIRTGTALLWRHSGNHIINTGIAAKRINSGSGATWYGTDFTIDLAEVDLPPIVTVEGLALFIKENDQATPTRVDWFSDTAFLSLYDSAVIAGHVRGKAVVSRKDLTLTDGKLRVRLAKPHSGDAGTIGALVIYYFPYVDDVTDRARHAKF